MRLILLAAAFGGSAHPVVVEQSQMVVQPPPTPPVPTEAPLPPSAPQMSPHLLLHPILDEAEAPARIPDGKVPDSTRAQNRVEECHHPSDRLRLKAAEDLLELLQQLPSASSAWARVARSPPSLATAYSTKLKTQESETFPFAQVYDPALLLVDLDVEFGQFLAQPLVHRPQQPVMARKGIHQNDQVIGIAARVASRYVYLPLRVVSLAFSSILSTSLR